MRTLDDTSGTKHFLLLMKSIKGTGEDLLIKEEIDEQPLETLHSIFGPQ